MKLQLKVLEMNGEKTAGITSMVKQRHRVPPLARAVGATTLGRAVKPQPQRKGVATDGDVLRESVSVVAHQAQICLLCSFSSLFSGK